MRATINRAAAHPTIMHSNITTCVEAGHLPHRKKYGMLEKALKPNKKALTELVVEVV